MKKLLAFLFSILLLSSQSVFAESFLFSCVSDKNFQILFEINSEKETVLFISSMKTDGSSKFTVNEFEKVVMWSDNRIAIFDNYASNTSHRTIFLKQDIMLNTGHYPDGTTHQQLFQCNRSE